MNNQAAFQVDVAQDNDGFATRLIWPGGAIFMSRLFRSKSEAEDARDRLVSAWGGPIEVLPTMVRKTVMVPDAQGIEAASSEALRGDIADSPVAVSAMRPETPTEQPRQG